MHDLFVFSLRTTVGHARRRRTNNNEQKCVLPEPCVRLRADVLCIRQ